MEIVRKVIAQYMTFDYSDSTRDRENLYTVSQAAQHDPRTVIGVAKHFVPILKEKIEMDESNAERGLEIAVQLMKQLIPKGQKALTLETLIVLNKLLHGHLNDVSVVKYLYRYNMGEQADAIIGYADTPEIKKEEEPTRSTPKRKAIKRKLLDRDTVSNIIDTRYMCKRNGQPLKASRTDPERSSYAVQVVNTLHALMRDCPSATDLGRLDETIDYIKSNNNVQGCKIKFSALACLIRVLTPEEKIIYFGDTFDRHFDLLGSEQNKTRLAIEEIEREQKPSERQVATTDGLKWQELVDFVHSVPFPTRIENSRDLKLARNIILVRLYTVDHDPRRLELTWLRFKRYDKKHQNYYDPATGVITLNEYKTSNIYGPYTFTPSDETRRQLGMLIDYLLKQRPDDYGLLDEECNIDQPDRGAYILQRAFTAVCGRPLGCQVLRKMRIEHAHQTGEIKFFKERAELARRMAHSVADQQLQYTVRDSSSAPPQRFESPAIPEPTHTDDAPVARAPGEPIPCYGRKKPVFPNSHQIALIKEAIMRTRPGEKVSWKQMAADNPAAFAGIHARTYRNWGARYLREATEG